MGKTRIAADVAASVSGSVRLEVEHAIRPLATRLENEFNGCEIAAYDLDMLAGALRRLKAGRRLRTNPYDWRSRRNRAEAQELRVLGNGGIVIDGTVAAFHPIVTECDLLCYFTPMDQRAALAFAVERDLEERRRSREQSNDENRRKFEYCKGLRDLLPAASVSSISIEVTVSEGDEFTFYISHGDFGRLGSGSEGSPEAPETWV